jgi:hypothetical protein
MWDDDEEVEDVDTHPDGDVVPPLDDDEEIEEVESEED